MEFWFLFVLFILLLVVAVCIIVYLVHMYKQQIGELVRDKHELLERNQHIVMENAALKAEITNANELIKMVKEQNEKDALSRQEQTKTEIRLAREQMRSQFEEEMLKRTDALKQANAEQLGQIVGPLQQELDRLRQLVSNTKEEQGKNTAALEAQIKAVFEHDKQRDITTQNLANALKNRGKVQGDWGEQVLANILRDSGLREGIEYIVQENTKDEEGNNMRPDVIVNASDGSRIIIDSKVSLTAYTDYVGAENDVERNAAIKANYESIWKHVEELAAKKYPSKIEQSVPLSLMFIPNEGSYILAMNKDPQLGAKAYRKGVLIINPTNLMVVLHLVLLTWQNTRQEQNNKDILNAATSIYEKYATFAEEYVKIGSQLNTVQTTYTRALGQLKEGKGNLSSRLENLLHMGITPSKRIPNTMQSSLPETLAAQDTIE